METTERVTLGAQVLGLVAAAVLGLQGSVAALSAEPTPAPVALLEGPPADCETALQIHSAHCKVALSDEEVIALFGPDYYAEGDDGSRSLISDQSLTRLRPVSLSFVVAAVAPRAPQIDPVPEPGTGLLLSAGLGFLALRRRR